MQAHPTRRAAGGGKDRLPAAASRLPFLCRRRSHRRHVVGRWPARLATVTVLAAFALAGFAGTPASADPGPGSGGQYLVPRGDTLSAIAQRFGVSVSALAAANGISNPDLIYAGNYLTIPAGGTAASGGGGAGDGTFTVQPGDTLSSLAAQLGVSVSALAAANGVTDPDLIYAGKVMRIPGAGGSSGGGGSTPAATTAPVSTASAGMPTKLAADPVRYNSYSSLFSQWANAYGIPVNLLKGLCWLESGWQPSVVSSTGAIGMCQFMPGTTKFVSRDLVGAPMNPWDPNDNIHMSAAYLHYLLGKSGGDVPTAVASYYQGYDSVTSRGMYSDTISYVQGVQSFANQF